MGIDKAMVGQEANYPLVAVAIDKDKGSQNALKWAIDHLMQRGQTLVLVHVNTKAPSGGQEDSTGFKPATDQAMKDIFLPFRCFCTRKDIQFIDVVLDDKDIVKALIEFASQAGIEKFVLGSPAKGGIMRRLKTDVPTSVSKGAPDFCTVLIISATKDKVKYRRDAARAAPAVSPLRQHMTCPSVRKPDSAYPGLPKKGSKGDLVSESNYPPLPHENSIKSPFSRNNSQLSARKSYEFSSFSDSTTDLSFISSSRPSVDRYQFPRLSTSSDSSMYDSRPSFESMRTPLQLNANDYSSYSQSSNTSWSSQNMDDVEAEMRRLKIELKQTMEMYQNACKEAMNSKQQARQWQMEEQKRLEQARLSEESAMQLVEREKAKALAAMEAAGAAHRIAELEAQKRMNAEKVAQMAQQEIEERKKIMDSMNRDVRYRKYSIEEIEVATNHFNESLKIGEGGYGPVFKGFLDHTVVAIKVLRPDAAQGRSQFQQEVEVLSCIRHPNMVLLVGACPEYGCLVYEFMANGSLDDRLFRRGGTPVIPWQHRFRIAAEIATSLLFLHQTKPEPLVHRDLKPGNILLDRNYVSKIADVGLARLVPPSVADTVTQYRMTSTAGTFCYIDPEYQQTGMLGVKSDIYSLGVMLLQIITAKLPMGLTHYVGRAIEKGTFKEILDPDVTDWPVEEAQRLAQVALKCCELRRKDRPDLATGILPLLNELKFLGEEQDCGPMPFYSQASSASSRAGGKSDPMYGYPGFSARGHSHSSSISVESFGGRN
ncbi:hypothetical protein LUZ60_000757 [Juncus effusus]|nr:hypothetical protein LUZ60_000757 [Juncus effusus]